MEEALWKDKCSICFDRNYQFHLLECLDQFCFYCFGRYIEEIVNNSWGLPEPIVACPVCGVEISDEEWMQLVPPKIALKFQQFNGKRSNCFSNHAIFTRTCQICERDNSAVPTGNRMALSTCLPQALDIFGPLEIFTILENISTVKAVDERQLKKFYRFIKENLKQFSEGQHTFLQEFSSSLIASIADYSEKLEWFWRHLDCFPFVNCGSCQEPLCLRCGENDWHETTCQDYLKGKLASLQTGQLITSIEHIKTLEYKLSHCKPCPNCSILIMRDDGCNKVNCTFCGFQFCWSCGEAWGPKCGFYTCGKTGVYDVSNANSENASQVKHLKPENGVPDIKHLLRP